MDKIMLLHKHAKNFMDFKAANPAYRCICYNGSSAIVANDHSAMKLNSIEVSQQIVDSTTGERFTGPYPKLDKIFAKNYESVIDIHSKEIPTLDAWIELAKMCKSVLKKDGDHSICLECKQDMLFIHARSRSCYAKLEALLPFVELRNAQGLLFPLNAQYFLNALLLFKDLQPGLLQAKFGYKVMMFEADEASVIICGMANLQGYEYLNRE